MASAPEESREESKEESNRGADAVRSALVSAAAELLSEAGPSSISVRDVARRAGVNHGQVHHYFGGKRGLLVAAMRQLAEGHWNAMNARSEGLPVPPLFALAEDPGYWRAVCQVVMEGDLELARIEVDEDLTVPRRALRALMEHYEIPDDDLDFKARFAAVAALQMGWVALEEFIMLIADVKDADRHQVRERVKKLLEDTMERAMRRDAESTSMPTKTP
jgi:AcrR family transcriptional regulator